MIDEQTSKVKYQVICEGKVITTVQTKHMAENVILNLSEDKRGLAKIVPVTDSGKQILFG